VRIAADEDLGGRWDESGDSFQQQLLTGVLRNDQDVRSAIT
jgi:hypothetical protein